MNQYLLVTAWSLTLLLFAGASRAQSPIPEIIKFADELCGAAPGHSSTEHGSTRSVELGANIDAKLAALLGKLGELGIGGSAKLRQENSTGILQKDLVAERTNSRDCRYRVFDRLTGLTDLFQENTITFTQTYQIFIPVSHVPYDPTNKTMTTEEAFAAIALATWAGGAPPDGRSENERCKESWVTFNKVSICVRGIKRLRTGADTYRDGDGIARLSVSVAGEPSANVDASSSGKVSLRTFLCKSIQIEGVPESFKIGSCPREATFRDLAGPKTIGKSRFDFGCSADEVKLLVSAQCKMPRK